MGVFFNKGVALFTIDSAFPLLYNFLNIVSKNKNIYVLIFKWVDFVKILRPEW